MTTNVYFNLDLAGPVRSIAKYNQANITERRTKVKGRVRIKIVNYCSVKEVLLAPRKFVHEPATYGHGHEKCCLNMQHWFSVVLLLSGN